MRFDRTCKSRRRRMLAAFSILALVAPSMQGWAPVRADEPRGLGRLFRFGKDREPEPTRPAGPTNPTSDEAPEPTPTAPSPFNPGALNPGGYGTSPRNLSTNLPSSMGLGASNLPSTPTPTNRIIPQPRTSQAFTEADPILTRISLGRSDDGQQFGMFLQIHADGTVIDTEGVHHVSHDALRPLVDALRAADVGRLKGHCGGPPTDFIEQVHLTVYDYNRGRLQANHFSYSGNPQGCDPSVKALQEAIDALQMKLSSPGGSSGSAEPVSATGYPAPATGGAAVPLGNDAAPPLPGAGPIGLTPVD